MEARVAAELDLGEQGSNPGRVVGPGGGAEALDDATGVRHYLQSTADDKQFEAFST